MKKQLIFSLLGLVLGVALFNAFPILAEEKTDQTAKQIRLKEEKRARPTTQIRLIFSVEQVRDVLEEAEKMGVDETVPMINLFYDSSDDSVDYGIGETTEDSTALFGKKKKKGGGKKIYRCKCGVSADRGTCRRWCRPANCGIAPPCPPGAETMDEILQ